MDKEKLTGHDILAFQEQYGVSTYKMYKVLKVSNNKYKKITTGKDELDEKTAELFLEFAEKKKNETEERVQSGSVFEVDAQVEFLSHNGKDIDKPGLFQPVGSNMIVALNIDAEIMKTHTPVVTLNKEFTIEKDIHVLDVIDFLGFVAIITYCDARPHRYVYKDVIGKIKFVKNEQVEIKKKEMER